MCEKDYWDKLSALGPIIIGIATVFFAYIQWRTAEKQRKQSLFAERYKAYEKVLIIRSLLQRGKLSNLGIADKNLIEENFFFLNHQFRFLFPTLCQEWLDKFYKIYLSLDERASTGRNVEPELWKIFRLHTEEGMIIIQKEMEIF